MTKNELKILSRLYKINAPTTQVELLNSFQNKYNWEIAPADGHDCLDYLCAKRYILGKGVPDDGYIISNKGKEYLTQRHRENLRYWIPIVISNLIALSALTVSIIALLQ